MGDNMNFMGMSDADFAAYGSAPVQEQQEEPAQDTPVNESPIEQEEITEEIQEEEEQAEEALDESETDETTDEVEEEESEESEEDTETAKLAEIGKAILQPFKANGTEMSVDNADEAIRLMQMGAGFTNKMRQLKPHFAVIETLRSNGLLEDPNQLNMLIDLANGDKEAIAALVRSSKIDPLDLNLEDNVPYTPNSYSATEAQVNQSVNNFAQGDNPVYQDTIKAIEGWDHDSRSKVMENQSVMDRLTQFKNNGVFDRIQLEMNKASLFNFGQTNQLQEFERIGLDLLNRGIITMDGVVKPKTQVLKPKAKVDSQEQKEVRKAVAAKPKKAVNKPKPKEYSVEDIMSMSDDQFNKLFPNK